MRDKKRCFYVKWEEEVAGLCSCLYFIFSKVCTEELFQEKVLTCPGNRLFVNKDQWAFPFSFPVLLPFSCHFCPHIYLLLSYPFQHLFSALSCSAALSAFTYTQLHHPTHSLQNSSYEKSLCLILCSTGLRWGGLSPAVEDPHTHHTSTHHPIAQKPSQTTCCPI